ncbi:unnamed protein product [Lepeophtheirus salmonis]|uniref:(salmon louse) hypothetical protein n=1 Tax=Lepeophtheirus salmonis TaxID=72036 RepID=A0A7R8CN75_LEPSM|nr:unnamed protein product [Lepeophtheirus salmonis]CAF2869603.1 unnamed protein product [Lepeophtheirus salmonis]
MSRVRIQNVIHIVLCGSGGPTPLYPPPYLSQSLCCWFFLHGLFKSGQSSSVGDVNFHRKINIQTLLIYGLKDKYVSLVEMCEMERTITKSYLEFLPMAGH